VCCRQQQRTALQLDFWTVSVECSCDTFVSFLKQLRGQFLTQNVFWHTHITATLQDTFNEERADKEIGKCNSRTVTLRSLSHWQSQLTKIQRHYFIWQLSLVTSRRLAERIKLLRPMNNLPLEVSANRRRIFPAPSLNVVSKNRILTAARCHQRPSVSLVSGCSRWQSDRSVVLTTHLLLASGCEWIGDKPRLPLCAWPARYGVTLKFTHGLTANFNSGERWAAWRHAERYERNIDASCQVK